MGRGEGKGTFLFDFYNRLFFKRPRFFRVLLSFGNDLKEIMKKPKMNLVIGRSSNED